MCLISKDNNLQIAKEPILAYKVLNRNYISPCRGFDYSSYVNDPNKVVCDTIPYPILEHFSGHYIVEEGLHLFTDLQYAKEFTDVGISCGLIFKCEIPIGAYFILGKYDEICTNQFKFMNEL